MRIDRAYPDIFTREEADLLHSLQGTPVEYRGRARIVRGYVPLDRSLYLDEGLLGRYSCDRAGRRQFVGLQVAGDYFDLSAYLLKHLEHDVDTLGEAAVRDTSHASLDMIGERYPALYQKLWRVSLIDAAVHRYWIFRTGRLAGKARLANFLAEMFVRLYARGLGSTASYPLPLSQNDLAEVCGMTSVHVNRLLRELRLDQVCTIADGLVLLHDLPALARLGQFSPDYLYLAPEIAAQVRALLAPPRA